MKQVKTTYEWIKCTTRKWTIFYLIVFFVLSFVAYRLESMYLSTWFSSLWEGLRMFSSLFVAMVITIWLYLMQLDSIQFELTSTMRSLLSHLRNIEPEAPWKRLEVQWLHCDDELNEIVEVLNKKSSQIQHHIDYLKKLIWYIQHEFKTPLWIIQLHTERLRKKWAPDTMYDGLQSIESEVTHLSSLTESIISLLSAQDTDITNENQHIDLWGLVRNIWDELMHINQQAQITYTWNKQIIIDTYPPFAKAILRNIIDNALTHWSDKISIDIQNNSIAISDQWTWISDEFYEHIRLPFRRKSSPKASSEWLWLWLSLVKELIDKLGRTIKATSNESWWMTFTIYFS